jgi:hypothetical protein
MQGVAYAPPPRVGSCLWVYMEDKVKGEVEYGED